MTLQELFSKDGTWIQGAYARRANGVSTTGVDPAAVCFCLVGGIEHVCKGFPTPEAQAMITKITNRLGSATAWNDVPGRTIEDVRALVKELAI